MIDTTLTRCLDLNAVNALDQNGFVAELGSTFEHSPWIAKGAWAAGPFSSIDALHGAMLGMVRSAPLATQIAFLCGHPELAGKEADAGTMTNESVGEQASAGLNALSTGEFDELRQLNAAYLTRHAFPFIVAVRCYSKDEIFVQLRARTRHDSTAELNEALIQIGLITRLRLQAKLAE